MVGTIRQLEAAGEIVLIQPEDWRRRRGQIPAPVDMPAPPARPFRPPRPRPVCGPSACVRRRGGGPVPSRCAKGSENKATAAVVGMIRQLEAAGEIVLIQPED